MIQPCPECHQTKRHKLSCDAPSRALRRGDGTVSTVGTVDTYSPEPVSDSAPTGTDSGACGGGGE